MANATIKITQLPSIGNALSVSTVLPVVNTTGTAITEKTTLGSIANLILTQAGVSLPAAFVSEIAYSVANAAQPNITSVGNSATWTFSAVGISSNPVLTVDALPATVAGMRAFVSDSNLAPVGNFGAIVGNSGSNTVCVWCDGTNWRIG